MKVLEILLVIGFYFMPVLLWKHWLKSETKEAEPKKIQNDSEVQ